MDYLGRSIQIAAGAAFAVAFAIQVIQIELQLFAAVGAVDLPFAQHAFIHADGIAAGGALYFIQGLVLIIELIIVIQTIIIVLIKS